MTQSAAGLTILSNRIATANSNAVDALYRYRISEPVNLLNLTFAYNLAPLQVESGATGTGVTPSHSANTRSAVLSCTSGTGTCFMQTYEWPIVQAGKSHFTIVAVGFGAAVAGAVVDAGLFDTNNGHMVRQNGTSGMEIVRRSSSSGSVVDTTVTQANWNLDKLDGTGPSGITFTPLAAQAIVIDSFERTRIGFIIGGEIIYVHQFNIANQTVLSGLAYVSLPVQVLITATSTGSTKTVVFRGATVDAEAGVADPEGRPFSTGEGTATAGATRTHLLSLRQKTTFNSLAYRGAVRMLNAAIIVTGSNSIFWELCIGSTFSAGPTWADVNTSYSGCEYGINGTLSTAGTVISSGYVGASAVVTGAFVGYISSKIPMGLDRAGAVRANGTVSLIATATTGTSATRATFDFKELR